MAYLRFVTILSIATFALAQSPTTSSQSTPTSLPTLPTGLFSPGSIVNCVAAMQCEQEVGLGEYSDDSCKYPTIECQCVAWNSTGYAGCLKEKCPDNWQAMRDEKLGLCTGYLKVDLSGNTTYTGIAMPTSSTNGTIFGVVPANQKSEDEGLSLSDKIAIGIGVGFGVPTIVVGLGAWRCARRRKEKKAEVEEIKLDDEERLTG
ncbi:hypothetical protein OQA88_1124 [Cercophora sp. LCS_1]